MGHHILILGLSGSLDESLAGRVAAELGRQGYGVRHAAHFYDGDKQTRLATGTPQDLQEDLARLGITVQCVLLNGAPPVQRPEWDGAAEVDPGNWGEVLTLLRRIDEHTTPQVQAPKKKKVAAGDDKAPPPPVNVPAAGAEEKLAGSPPADEPPGGWPAVQPPKEAPPPSRDVVQGICTRCGGMFEGEEAENHLNDDMCEPKVAQG